MPRRRRKPPGAARVPRVSLDPLDPASWIQALDRKVDEGLKAFLEGLVPDQEAVRLMTRTVGHDRWVQCVALLFAGNRRGLSGEPLRAFIADGLGGFVAPDIDPRAEEPIDTVEFHLAVPVAENPAAALKVARRLGVGEFVQNTHDYMKLCASTPGVGPEEWEKRVEWAEEYVREHRALLREVAFFDDPRGRWPLVRVALGMLDTLRNHHPRPPEPPRRGPPADPELTVIAMMEAFVFPGLPGPGEAIKSWVGGRGDFPWARGLQAAREALGLPEWTSPRDTVMRLLSTIGNDRAKLLLQAPPPGYKNVPLGRARRSLAAARSRGRTNDAYRRRLRDPAEVALLNAGLLRQVFGGEFADRLLTGKDRVWLEPGEDGLRPEDPIA